MQYLFKRYLVGGGADFFVEYRWDDSGPVSILFHKYPGQHKAGGHNGLLHANGELALADRDQPYSLDRAIVLARRFMKNHSRYLYATASQTVPDSRSPATPIAASD